MVDFTSALYLNMAHPSSSLPPWGRLTTGQPAVLQPATRMAGLTKRLAMLIGCDNAVLMPSTLHAFCDVFEYLAQLPISILVDAAAYPIARMALDRLIAIGIRVLPFRHQDPIALAHCLSHMAGDRRMPIVVSDGYCPICSQFAPIATYVSLIDHYNGIVIIDDTQALGVFGRNPCGAQRYGMDGGGSLSYFDISSPSIISVSSLAKGFGVPIAFVAGKESFIAALKRHSWVGVHCSPPSTAVLAALWRALSLNRLWGQVLRQRLLRNVLLLKAGLRKAALATQGIFPVVSVRGLSRPTVASLRGQLLRHGFRTVMMRGHATDDIRLMFLVTTAHKPCDILQLTKVLSVSVSQTYAKKVTA